MTGDWRDRAQVLFIKLDFPGDKMLKTAHMYFCDITTVGAASSRYGIELPKVSINATKMPDIYTLKQSQSSKTSLMFSEMNQNCGYIFKFPRKF